MLIQLKRSLLFNHCHVFPVIRNREAIPSFVQIGDTHTYNHSALWRRKTREPRAEKIELARQQRKAGKSLLGLQQRLQQDVALATLCLQEMEDGIELPIAMGRISHLSVPEVFASAIGANLSVPEVFASAIGAIEGGSLSDREDDKAKIRPHARPLVRFELTRKTFHGGSVNLNSKMAGTRESVYWIRADDERDEKKRRVEYILRYSIDKPEELNQP